MEWPYPTVRHLLACRRPMPIDPEYREAILRVVFALRPPRGATFPFRLPELYAFAQVVGGVGTFELSVGLYRMDTDPVLVGTAQEIDITFTDRVTAHSFFRGMAGIPLERPGLYELRLFARLLRDASGAIVHNQPRRLLTGEPIRMEEST